MIFPFVLSILSFLQTPSAPPMMKDRPAHLQRYKLSDLVLTPRRDDPELFDSGAVECPMILRWRDQWVMYYTGIRYNEGKADSTIGRAVSDDLIHWRDRRQVLPRGRDGAFDHGGVSGPFAWIENDRINLIYVGFPRLGYETKPGQHGLAVSTDGVNFERAAFNPIHTIGPKGSWNDDVVYKVFVMKHRNQYWMFYNAFGSKDKCEQIGLATSIDLRRWSEHPDNPLLRKGNPDKDRDQVIIGDPWIMRQGDTWEMFYFAFDGKHARECLATSKDLVHWTKSPLNPIMDVGPEGSTDAVHCHKPSIVVHENVYYHFYTAVGRFKGQDTRAIGLATSKKLDGVKYRDSE